jgi:predicted ATPase
MQLSRIRVKGFQSFEDSGSLEFLSGINLVVGENNSGKSALLRSMRADLADDRHRNSAQYEDFVLAPPSVELDIEVTGAELGRALLQRRAHAWIPFKSTEVERAKLELDDFIQASSILFKFMNWPGGAFGPRQSPCWETPIAGDFQRSFQISTEGGKLTLSGGPTGLTDDLPVTLNAFYRNQLFYFNAERFSIDRCAHQHAERLSPDASNLPAVLFTMVGNRGTLFSKLVSHLRDVFPSIGNLSVRPFPGTPDVEIRVWPTEEMHRTELGFPLSQCGTGVGQVIAIFAAIMTFDKTVLLIDEINSFLHPSAVKSLLRIIQTDYISHQYIISTHSPEVISFANPSTLHLVTRDGYKSSVSALDTEDVQSFREIAGQLGITMSDVFAADKIVWVEGLTEELCFPFLYESTFGPMPRGMKISSVIATGDFNAKGRDATLIFEIYERISTAAAPLTKSVSFSFDSESLTPAEKENMGRRSRGKVKFLPRRHLECFLVDRVAIASFLGEKDSHPAPSPDDVEKELCKIAATMKFDKLKIWQGDLADEKWLCAVDAANLIKDVCATLSENRVTFSKGHDSLILLQYLLRNEPKKVAPLAKYVKALIEKT